MYGVFSVRVRGTNPNTLNMSTSRNPQDYRNTGRLRNTCRSSPLLLEKSDISVTCPVYLFLLMLGTPSRQKLAQVSTPLGGKSCPFARVSRCFSQCPRANGNGLL
ncbi:Hypothetical protein J6889_04437 [Nakaseomyces glabratus]